MNIDCSIIEEQLISAQNKAAFWAYAQELKEKIKDAFQEIYVEHNPLESAVEIKWKGVLLWRITKHNFSFLVEAQEATLLDQQKELREQSSRRIILAEAAYLWLQSEEEEVYWKNAHFTSLQQLFLSEDFKEQPSIEIEEMILLSDLLIYLKEQEALPLLQRYKPIVQKIMPYLLQDSTIQDIIQTNEYYYEKVLACWKAFKEYPLSEEMGQEYEQQIYTFEGTLYHLAQSNLSSAPFVQLLGQLISYIDKQGQAKKQWNHYVDQRTVGETELNQKTWVRQLLLYKTKGKAAMSSGIIVNALNYLEHRVSEVPLLSVRQRCQITERLFCTGYKPHLFAQYVQTFFAQFTLPQVGNSDNQMVLYSILLQHPELAQLWKNTREEAYESFVVEEPQISQHHSKLEQQPQLNLLYYGPPGTGKTYMAMRKALSLVKGIELNSILAWSEERFRKAWESVKEREQVLFCTFHPSMSYEDFVEGIKPVVVEGSMQYKVVDGLFKRFAQKANQHKDQNWVVLIDEINRGPVSAIFGELISLIEVDKRQGANNALEVELPYSKATFSLPSNLYVLGTMNTLDQSTERLDMAFRRRFNFVEIQPNYHLLLKDVEGVNLQELLKQLNRNLSQLLGLSYQIGQSYLMGVRTIKELNTVFQEQIIPLLVDYFYGDITKLKAILGERFISAGQVQKGPWSANCFKQLYA